MGAWTLMEGKYLRVVEHNPVILSVQSAGVEKLYPEHRPNELDDTFLHLGGVHPASQIVHRVIMRHNVHIKQKAEKIPRVLVPLQQVACNVMPCSQSTKKHQEYRKKTRKEGNSRLRTDAGNPQSAKIACQ